MIGLVIKINILFKFIIVSQNKYKSRYIISANTYVGTQWVLPMSLEEPSNYN